MSQISAAKLAANRANGRISTGPVTQEGKERSRQNAVKHGMTAGVVISEELREKAEERVKSWTKSMRPQTEPEAWLVERAAVDSVRVDAASRCERARTEARLRYDVLYSRAEGISEVAAAKSGMELMQVHHTDVPNKLIQLRTTRAGCEWLRNRWDELKRRHGVQQEWQPRDFYEAQRLCGMNYLDDVVTPICARVAVEFMLSSKDGLENNRSIVTALNGARWLVKVMSGPDHPPGDPKTIARANQRLAGFIDDQIAALEERLVSLREVEELDDSLAAERMLVDLSPDGKLLHRYEAELVRRVHQSLDQLARIRKSTGHAVSSESSQPEPARSPMDVKAPQLVEKPSRNEPNSADVMESQACTLSVPKAPSSVEKPSRNEPDSAAPSTPILPASRAAKIHRDLPVPPSVRKARRKGA